MEFSDSNEGAISNLIAELARLALAEDVPLIRQAMLRQIGFLTNKFLPSQKTSEVVSMMKNLISGLVGTTIVSENAVRILFWEARGLILRLSHTEEVLGCLLALLSHPECGLISARGFGLLLASDEVFSRENGANVRLLAKQKVLNICMSTIPNAFRNADTTTKPNYLIALSGILNNVTPDVMLPEIEALLPLLLLSLDLNDPAVKAATIQSLIVVCQESPKSMEGHAGSLVERLIKSMADSESNTVDVRHKALRCLRSFPGNMKDSTLLPLRNRVIRGLLSVLDDPRRNIRKEAVECRASWFNMDEPQSE